MIDSQFCCFGVDVAAEGANESVCAVRVGCAIQQLVAWQGADTMESVERIAALSEVHRPQLIVIDAAGVGAGVFHRLRELGYPVAPFIGAEATDATDSTGQIRFANKRAHAWWHLRELLHPLAEPSLVLPDDPALALDLATPRYSTDGAGGRLRVEKKSELMRRLPKGRSPDRGDACVLAFYDGSWSEFERGWVSFSARQLDEELARQRRAAGSAKSEPTSVDFAEVVQAQLWAGADASPRRDWW